ncbi:MAG: hypothetical protein DRR08_18500 [Candidatus Parabeggiatoa sp. nov. 2]|nr:MAG: hypothetical protein B6247_04935 [Beggiatoa sp. 4572_84]RKZ57627.1 MAG: hypothetical protein DRR08_18500 [Gammaproteobacteria bacterium]
MSFKYLPEKAPKTGSNLSRSAKNEVDLLREERKLICSAKNEKFEVVRDNEGTQTAIFSKRKLLAKLCSLAQRMTADRSDASSLL